MPCVFLSRPSSVLPCSSRHAYPAQAFPDGSSTALRKRKRTLFDVPTGILLSNFEDIKQESVQTSLLEEYGLSKKWVIFMDRR